MRILRRTCWRFVRSSPNPELGVRVPNARLQCLVVHFSRVPGAKLRLIFANSEGARGQQQADLETGIRDPECPVSKFRRCVLQRN